eukprot:g3665.t1
METGSSGTAARVIAKVLAEEGEEERSAVSELVLSNRGLHSVFDAFKGFTALLVLDLSRNALVSLDGLACCTSLERLSVYYNRLTSVDSVDELLSLRFLRSLDLRLNPMTRSSAYRKMVIAKLPQLEELDERHIRNAERKKDDNDEEGHGEDEEIEDASGEVEEILGVQFVGMATARDPSVADGGAWTDAAVSEGRGGGGGGVSSSAPLRMDPQLAELMEKEINAVVNELTHAVSSVELPRQLALTGRTITHIPDLVARASRRKIIQVLRRCFSDRDLRHSQALDDLEESMRKCSKLERKLERADEREKVMRAQMEATETQCGTLSAELAKLRAVVHAPVKQDDMASAEVINSMMEAHNMLRESHRALMSNEARVQEELLELKKKYRRDAEHWKSNFDSLKELYASSQAVMPAPLPSPVGPSREAESAPAAPVSIEAENEPLSSMLQLGDDVISRAAGEVSRQALLRVSREAGTDSKVTERTSSMSSARDDDRAMEQMQWASALDKAAAVLRATESAEEEEEEKKNTMYTPGSTTEAFVILVFVLFCWGSWACPLKVAKVPLPLFYLDTALGIFLTTVLLGLTLGSDAIFHSTGADVDNDFISNMLQASWTHVAYAAASGAVFNFGNILFVNAIRLVGMAVAFPLAVGTSLICGSTLSYAVDPRQTQPAILFLGVLLGVIAITAMSFAHKFLEAGRQTGAGATSESSELLDRGGSRKISASSLRNTLLCVVSGIGLGGWTPLIVRSQKVASDPLPGTPLLVYGAVFWFALSLLLTTMLSLSYWMKNPVDGSEPCALADMRAHTLKEHLILVSGGALWTLGTVLNVAAAIRLSQAVSFSIGASAPLVGTAWGVWYFNEFEGASRKTYAYLILSVIFYMAAVFAFGASASG